MERSLFRYILRHTWRDQAWLLVVTCLSFPLIYVNLELPKLIVNSAIGGKKLPHELAGVPVTQVGYLMVLSVTLLALITVNGAIKYWLNVYRGVVGERMVRRLRYELYHAVLRFPLSHFKRTSAGEIIPMITSETDPIGGFIGDSISMPAFQGGLLATYMLFIFMQDFWLGLAAVVLYPFQVWLIPRLQRRINQLSKQRIKTTRELSDRIGDVIGGATAIRANDTARYELADVSRRLGTIYAIRFDIYKRKFFVKFLNNFLAQITPFFFYAIGGYFVIKGQLSLGALVAVLAAYKDIIDPWKELLKWYETKEDVRVKYEQVVSQFEPPGLVAPELLETRPDAVPRLAGALVAASVSYRDESSGGEVAQLALEIPPGQRVAVVGGGDSGRDELMHLLARLEFPGVGRITVGDVSLATAPVAVTGSRIAYAERNAHVFSGSLMHNLLYGLKHRPVRPATYEGEAARLEERRVHDARIAANSVDDIAADWVDIEGAGIVDREAHALDILKCVESDRGLIGFGLASHADPERHAPLVAQALEARRRVRDRVRSPELASLVELFDQDRFNANISLAENLLFGAPRDDAFRPERLAQNDEVRALLAEEGLLEDLEAVGIEVARLMVELFADEPEDSELFAGYSFIRPEDLAEFRALLRRLDERGRGSLSDDERKMLLSLAFKIVTGVHRLAVCDAAMQARIVAARRAFRARFEGRGVVDFFDPERYSAALSIQDNIVFGRPVFEEARAAVRVDELVREIAAEIGMEPALIRRGLDADVGASGARLNYAQKQRLVIGRALMKNADVLVFNEPTAGLDPATERRLVANVLAATPGKTVVWALGRTDLAELFDRVLVMEHGRIVEDGTYAELAKVGRVLPKLLAS